MRGDNFPVVVGGSSNRGRRAEWLLLVMRKNKIKQWTLLVVMRNTELRC